MLKILKRKLSNMGGSDLYLSSLLRQACGLRGLFDPYASEWKECEPSEKIVVLTKMMEYLGCDLSSLIDVYGSWYTKSSSYYKVQCVPDALRWYAIIEKWQPAVDCLSKHPGECLTALYNENNMLLKSYSKVT